MRHEETTKNRIGKTKKKGLKLIVDRSLSTPTSNFHPLCSITPKLLFLSDWALGGRCPPCLPQWNCNVFQVSVWVSLGVMRPESPLLVKAPKMLCVCVCARILVVVLNTDKWMCTLLAWKCVWCAHVFHLTYNWGFTLREPGSVVSFSRFPGEYAQRVLWEYQRAVRMTQASLWVWEDMQNKQLSSNCRLN